MKIIQIGLGGWGRNWHKTYLSKTRGITVTAVVDRSAKVLEMARSELALPEGLCFTSLKAALAAVPADAALVTADLTGHVPLCREALNSGLHVLTEKPFAPRVKDARALVELAAEKRRTLMVSQNYRFYPAVRTVAGMIASGKLGAITTIAIDFRKYANASAKPGNKHYALNHPMLSDMAIHHYDLLRLVAGVKPVDVYCRTTNPSWSRFDGPPAAFGVITFENGVTASYRGSWISHRKDTSWAGTWSIECEKGAITWESRGNENGTDDRVSITRTGEEPAQVPLKKVKYLDRAGSLNAFVRAIKSGEEPECSGGDNIGTLELMFAMVKSAESGRPVKLT